MLISKLITRLAALFGAAIILASCTVVAEEPPTRPLPPRPDRPQICTREYAPVCARAGSRQRTFSNACMARAAGFRVQHPGQCPPQSSRPDRPQACTMEYRPVCAKRGGSIRTFGNACGARAEGYRVIRPGACR